VEERDGPAGELREAARYSYSGQPLLDSGAEQLRDPVAGQQTSARREQDVIEIHIGRIEVTAVNQPPVARADKPPRKTLSLDEYLNRGNRRGT
jgi:hypothetical protein